MTTPATGSISVQQVINVFTTLTKPTTFTSMRNAVGNSGTPISMSSMRGKSVTVIPVSINPLVSRTSSSIQVGTFNTNVPYGNQFYSWRLLRPNGTEQTFGGDNVNWERTINGLASNTTYTYTVTLNGVTVSINYSTTA